MLCVVTIWWPHVWPLNFHAFSFAVNRSSKSMMYRAPPPCETWHNPFRAWVFVIVVHIISHKNMPTAEFARFCLGYINVLLGFTSCFYTMLTRAHGCFSRTGTIADTTEPVPMKQLKGYMKYVWLDSVDSKPQQEWTILCLIQSGLVITRSIITQYCIQHGNSTDGTWLTRAHEIHRPGELFGVYNC